MWGLSIGVPFTACYTRGMMTITEIIELIGLVISLASIITSWTPTTVDDKWLSAIKVFIGRLGIAKFHDAPGSLKLPGQDPR